jgi:hypothetical protein
MPDRARCSIWLLVLTTLAASTVNPTADFKDGTLGKRGSRLRHWPHTGPAPAAAACCYICGRQVHPHQAPEELRFVAIWATSCRHLSIIIRQRCFACRYTPELSRQCTHLVTTLQHATAKRPSAKLALAVHNAHKWQTYVVDIAWAEHCAAKGMQLPATEFLVPAISAAAAAEVTAHVMAAARTAADGKCQSAVLPHGNAAVCSTELRLPLRSLHEQAALRRSMQPPSPRPPSAKVTCARTPSATKICIHCVNALAALTHNNVAACAATTLA